MFRANADIEERPLNSSASQTYFLKKLLSGSEDYINWIWSEQQPEVFFKNDVLKNFAKFIGKHLLQSLLII